MELETYLDFQFVWVSEIMSKLITVYKYSELNENARKIARILVYDNAAKRKVFSTARKNLIKNLQAVDVECYFPELYQEESLQTVLNYCTFLNQQAFVTKQDIIGIVKENKLNYIPKNNSELTVVVLSRGKDLTTRTTTHRIYEKLVEIVNPYYFNYIKEIDSNFKTLSRLEKVSKYCDERGYYFFEDGSHFCQSFKLYET